MARIEGAKSGNWMVKLAYYVTKKKTGKVLMPVQIMAHHPTILGGFGYMERTFRKSKSVDLRLKDLVQLRTASVIGCSFCIDASAWIGKESGLTEDQIVHVNEYETHAAYSELDRICLRFADCLTATPSHVPDELFAELEKHFNRAQLVELASAIAWENYRARFNHAFGAHSEGLSAICPIPPRKATDKATDNPPRTA